VYEPAMPTQTTETGVVAMMVGIGVCSPLNLKGSRYPGSKSADFKSIDYVLHAKMMTIKMSFGDKK
jgi:hypothetical protein